MNKLENNWTVKTLCVFCEATSLMLKMHGSSSFATKTDSFCCSSVENGQLLIFQITGFLDVLVSFLWIAGWPSSGSPVEVHRGSKRDATNHGGLRTKLSHLNWNQSWGLPISVNKLCCYNPAWPQVTKNRFLGLCSVSHWNIIVI